MSLGSAHAIKLRASLKKKKKKEKNNKNNIKKKTSKQTKRRCLQNVQHNTWDIANIYLRNGDDGPSS